MKKKKLILYDSEADYVRRMSEFLENSDENPFEIHCYTRKEKLEEYLQQEKPEVFLIAESVYEDRYKKGFSCVTVILHENGILKDPELFYVGKFQKADHIIHEVLNYYLKKSEDPFFYGEGKKHSRMIGFYSPVRRCMQTSAALMMGRVLSEYRKTLYLNFENYAGMQGLQKPGCTHDLSDLIYFFENTKEKFLYHLQAMTGTIGRLAYVPPMFSSQNLIYITGRQWLDLLSFLAVRTDYEYIILDLSDNIQGLFDILRICTRVYTVTEHDKTAISKMNQYKQLLQMYEYPDVLKKTGHPDLSVFREFSGKMEEDTKRDFENYIRGLVQKDLGISVREGETE